MRDSPLVVVVVDDGGRRSGAERLHHPLLRVRPERVQIDAVLGVWREHVVAVGDGLPLPSARPPVASGGTPEVVHVPSPVALRARRDPDEVLGEGAVELRARRQRSRDAALRAKYLRIVMLYLLAGEGPAPRFPMIRRAGARLLLVETVAGLAGVTYGLDAAPLRRIVAEYGLDAWLLRRTARSRGYRRARCLLLLSRLPVGAAAADCAARYAASRNRYVRFQSLMVRLEADPSTALRLMAEYPEPFSACEVGEIMAVLRRGMLPIAYEPLIGSPSRNLRIVGLNIVRQFGIEEAERLLLRIVSGDEDPELVREALYTLCALRRPLTRRAVSGRLSAMPPAERKALLRYVVAEGYSPGPLRRLLDERERPYYESLVQTYKRSLA